MSIVNGKGSLCYDLSDFLQKCNPFCFCQNKKKSLHNPNVDSVNTF